MSEYRTPAGTTECNEWLQNSDALSNYDICSDPDAAGAWQTIGGDYWVTLDGFFWVEL
jgi:hypothetical protein